MDAKTKKLQVDQAVKSQSRRALSCRGVFTVGQSGRFGNTSRRRHWRRIWRKTDFKLSFRGKISRRLFALHGARATPLLACWGSTTHCPIAVPRRAPGATAEVIIFWALPRPQVRLLQKQYWKI